MKQDPSRGGGSTLSPAYSAALERLAKKRLIGDAPADEPARIGNAPAGGRPIIGGTGKGGLGIVGDALNMAKGIVLSPVATAADIAWKPFEAIPGAPDFNPEDAGTVNLFVQGGKSLKHVTGDAYQLGRSIITGKDTLSESPTAKAWKAAGGGLPGVLAVAGPYLDVGSVVAPMAMGAARGAGLVAPVPVPYEPLTVADLNAARETFGAPTNAYRTTRKALAEDMAQAQVPRPTVAPATISPRLEVPTMAPTVPDMPPGFPLPEVPSNMTLRDFQRMPEYQAYIEAGQSIDPQAMAGFAFDPETAYLVHSGRGQLIGGKLDPYRTLSGLNDSHTRAVLAGRDRAIASADILQDQLDTFVRTGIWNGDELAQRMPPGYSSEGGKFPLKGIVKASDMSERQLQEFVDRIQTRINEHIDFYSSVEPFAALARREPFLSYYPAPVGGKSGYMGWHSGPEGGGMYLAAVPADRATTLFGPGIYEKRLGVPEWQAFGEQTPIASIGQFPKDWSGYSQLESATRAFAVQKTIEDRMRRGFYGDVTPQPLPVRSFSGDFVPVGNAARRPDGSPIRLSTPDESAMFVSFGYSLREVPTEHLFDAVTKNVGFRFDPIPTQGITQGVVRFRDKVTGEVIDFRNGMPATSGVTAPQAGRVAPGFITSEPVPVGNIGKLPSGVDVELATPEQSVAFVAEQGSLDQVPTEHLWQTITENSGPGKRFEQIGGGGGATGMDRFRDTVTGQQMGLKHVPGEQNLVANGFIARTFFETLSDDVGSAVGIPRMGVRTVVNSDGSVSLVTELAQSVYDGEIMDSFQAMTRSPDGAPALGNRVTVNSRIRKALLDDLLENEDVHDGNQLFVINNDGTVDIIPIDLEHTFSSIQSVLNPQNLISKVFSVDDVREIRWGQFSDVDRKGVENWSLRNRIVQDTDNLRDEIQAVIKTVQRQLSVDNLEREMKLRIDEIGRSYQRVAGANSANLDKFLKQASQTVELFMTRIGEFLDTPAKDIADAYIKAIEAGVFA